MEGCGQLRYTEGLAQLYSKPNKLDNRYNTLFDSHSNIITLLNIYNLSQNNVLGGGPPHYSM